MPKKFTEEEYQKMLPKKQTGTAVIFFNADRNLLIVKPGYKNTWLVPGGSIDEDESPLHCARREVKEEIGLDITDLKLVGIYYSHKKLAHSDSLKFIFYGGVLSEDQIAHIIVQEDELERCDFVPLDKALLLLSQSLKQSIPQAIAAIKNNSVAYMEASGV